MKNCIKCNSENIYQDGVLWVCPECGFECTEEELLQSSEKSLVKDANGNVLKDGDSVIVIKDLKINGSTKNVVKGGTKVKNIRLSDMGDGHDIGCKIPGLGSINLKSEYVKKA
jgi:protein PhnA